MCRADDGQTVDGVNIGMLAEQAQREAQKQRRMDFMDHMAKAALTGILANTGDRMLRQTHGQTAQLAYDFAEAMWVEREARRT